MRESRKKSTKRRRKRQLALLTLIVLIASIAAIMLLTPGFDIKEIKVSGNMALAKEDIINSSGLITGVNIFSVNLKEVEKNIKSEGYIKSVKVTRVLPSTIKISVVEEVGVAYLTAQEGYVKIAADGRCVEVTDGVITSENGVNITAPPKGLPKISGMENVKYKVGKAIETENERQLESLLECLNKFTKHGYVFDMIEIDVADTSEIKFYYKSKDLCVSVGRAENLDYKLECFNEIYKYVVEHAKEGEMPSGFIDLERNTYRPEEEPKTNSDSNTQNSQ